MCELRPFYVSDRSQTISYNASVVEIYITTNSIVHFENKIFPSTLKSAIAYYNAGVVCSC
jgi:hypothetical protein